MRNRECLVGLVVLTPNIGVGVSPKTNPGRSSSGFSCYNRVFVVLFVLSLFGWVATAQAADEEAAWTLDLKGGEEIFDLPDLVGVTLAGRKGPFGRRYSFSGLARGESGEGLNFSITDDEDLAVGEYKADGFTVTYETVDYICQGNDKVVLDITQVFESTGIYEKIKGTFEGPVECVPRENAAGNTADGEHSDRKSFEAIVSGTFNSAV